MAVAANLEPNCQDFGKESVFCIDAIVHAALVFPADEEAGLGIACRHKSVSNSSSETTTPRCGSSSGCASWPQDTMRV
jgi:hypothetical protein